MWINCHMHWTTDAISRLSDNKQYQKRLNNFLALLFWGFRVSNPSATTNEEEQLETHTNIVSLFSLAVNFMQTFFNMILQVTGKSVKWSSATWKGIRGCWSFGLGFTPLSETHSLESPRIICLSSCQLRVMNKFLADGSHKHNAIVQFSSFVRKQKSTYKM